MENIPHHKDFTRSKPEDVSAFLCHFLDGRSITPTKVLRAATFDVFALQALCEVARFTCLQRLSLTLILTRSLRTMTEFFLSICFLWEAYRDCFYDSSFSLRFFLEFSHVESFTTSLRYQALLSFL